MNFYKGNIAFTPEFDRVETYKNSYILVNDNGAVEGIYATIPQEYANVPVIDFGDSLILPGYTDLHMHSAQQASAGLGYDEHEKWFSDVTLPAESRYTQDLPYAHNLNKKLAYRLWKNGVINSVINSTENLRATIDLFEQMKKSGLSSYVGKMNSDRVYFDDARETTQISKDDSLELLRLYGAEQGNVRLIFAPEFIPCCTDEIMSFLGQLALQHNIPVTSHMAEGRTDTRWVKEKYNGELYGKIYHRHGLLGQVPTVMAHCTYATEEEIALMAQTGTYVAHCPQSSLDLPSDKMADIKAMVMAGVPVGLGSDIGGGHTLCMPHNIVAAAQISRWVNKTPLTTLQAYYLATKGGGSFFGKSGSFEKGYNFDCIVVDDSFLQDGPDYTLTQRLIRYIYCPEECNITHRFCKGIDIPRPEL